MLGEVAELEHLVEAAPDGWRIGRLGDVSRSFAGGTPSRSNPAFYGSGIPWLKSGEVRAGRIHEIEEQITEAGLRGSSARMARAGSPVIAMYGATAGVAGILEIDAALNQAVLAIEPEEAKLHREFCFHLLSSEAPRLLTMTQGSGQPNLSKGLIDGLYVALPPLDEQRRIAEVLRSVDEALHAARQVAEQCEQVLRLELDNIVAKLVADSVAQVKLGEVAKVKGGKRLPKGSEYSDEPTANPYIRVTDWRDYEIRTNDIRFISDDIAQSIWRYTISKSDLFISIAGSVGLVASVPDELDGAYLTENAAKICISDPNALNATFLVAVLRSRTLAEQISRHKGIGGGVPKLALFRIEDLYIPLPSLATQAEIAVAYTSMRASAEAARKAADQVERTRKEVRCDLLSGRVRVPA